MRTSLIAIGLICCSRSILLFAVQPDSHLDSLIAVQKEATGANYQLLDANYIDQSVKTNLRFLYAYLPYSDHSGVTPHEDADYAGRARDQFPWVKLYDEDIYRHFVLPHRVAQEPYVPWRSKFNKELSPRVKELTMEQAALEVNHWCYEKATFQQTDPRDQDPLTTIRRGFGRCEEEMILAICALRSVGIPARACYTPYWAHTDNNHAWVELWVDDEWRYFGACEPEPVLNQAWFTGAAARAMLVLSTVYGDYHGAEPVLKRYDRSTLINSTAVYGEVRQVVVKVTDASGRPLAGRQVYFSLWNYGAMMPAMALNTDDQGEVKLDCGLGDWFISAGDEQAWALAHNRSDEPVEELILTPADWDAAAMEFDYQPPPEAQNGQLAPTSAETEARGLTPQRARRAIVPKDSLFLRRLAQSDSIRNLSPWPRLSHAAKADSFVDISLLGRRWLTPPDSVKSEQVMIPDSEAVWAQPVFAELPDSVKGEILELLRTARGNWLTVYHFLIGQPTFVDGTPSPFGGGLFPNGDLRLVGLPKFGKPWPSGRFSVGWKYEHLTHPEPLPEFEPVRLEFIRRLSSKDLVDCENWLYDVSRSEVLLSDETIVKAMHYVSALSGEERDRWLDFVLHPRIDYEPIDRRVNSELIVFLKWKYEELPDNSPVEAMAAWLGSNVTVESSPDRLGPPLSPYLCLNLKRGSRSDVERLFIALCRARGIPARRNQRDFTVEVWQKGEWRGVELFHTTGRAAVEKEKGFITFDLRSADQAAGAAKYMQDWSIQRWENGRAVLMDFGYHKALDEFSSPLELLPGRYLLSTGKRNADGSAPVRLEWFSISAGDTAQARFSLR